MHLQIILQIMNQLIVSQLNTEWRFGIQWSSEFTEFNEGSEFSSYKIELRNRVTQNDVTLRVTN